MSQPDPKRRSFIKWLWTGFGLLALAEFVWIGLSFLRPRRRQDEKETTLLVCGPIDEFEPGSVTAFPAGRFYLVRLDDGGFLALHRECTHLGCTVPWSPSEGRFVCPCHASTFDIAGRVLAAPAPRPLDLLAVRLENGIVKVDTHHRQKRSEFLPEQVVRV
jgi:cytochrome b6-f complex iron-sulfur subunit